MILVSPRKSASFRKAEIPYPQTIQTTPAMKTTLSHPRHAGFLFALLASFLLLASSVTGVKAADQYFDGSGPNALTASTWAPTNLGPFTSAFTANNTAVFATVNGSGSGAGTISVGGIRAEENFTLNSPSGTLATGGTVATVNVLTGKTLDFGSLGLSTAAGTGFIKSGSGVWATAGGNFAGGFTLNDGTMILRAIDAMGDGGTLTINGGTIAADATRDLRNQYDTGITIGGNFTLGATTGLALSNANLTFNNTMALGAATRTITIGGTGVYTLGGIISGAGGTGLTVVSTAAGTIDLTGVNTYTGATTISGGTLKISNASTFTNTSAINLSSGGRLDLNVANQSLAKLVSGTGSGVVAGSFLRYSTAQTTGTTGPGTIFGTVELNLTNVNPNYTLDFGTGSTLTNLVTSTYTSPITLSGNASIDSSTAVATYSTGGITTSSAGAKTLTLTGSNAGANTISSAITDGTGGNGTLAVTKTGTGTWNLTGSNNFSGGLTIKSGTLIVNTTVAAAGTGTITLGDTTPANSNNATLNLLVAGNPTYANNITVAAGSSGTLTIAQANGSGSVTLNGTVALNNNLTLFVDNVSKAITFNNLLTQTSVGSPALTISTASTATGKAEFKGGVEIGTGGLTFTNNGTTSTMTVGTGNITSTTNGNLAFNANNSAAITVSAASINHSGSITNSGTGNGTTTISGVIGANVNGVIQNSATSKLSLSNANTYTGATTISAGTLILATAGTIANSSGVNLGTSGSQGTLDLTAKTSGFALGSNQTLSGYGNVTMAAGRTLTINGGLAPGNSPGVIGISGNLTLGGTATTTMDLIDYALSPGTGFDQISLSGTTPALIYGGTLTLNLTGSTQLGVYHLFTGFSSQSGTFTGINYSGGAGSFDYATGDLTLTAVPEPATWALLAVSLTTVMILRRRRQS